ncbi:MAG: CRISPR-associated ring nuclease Crn3/Csx3 [Pirellulales bacterium]
MRLLSFLGNLPFKETNYSFDGKEKKTQFVVHALASFLTPTEIHILATNEAWDMHGKLLPETLASNGHPTPERVPVPTGGGSQQLWEMFGAIVESIRTSAEPVLLDITHGFRMQPFFAAACVQYIQAVVPNPPPIRVFYGEFRGENNQSPIWELTPFLDVLFWSRNLMMFLRTGQADEVGESTRELGRKLRRQWVESDRNDSQPRLESFGQAVQSFGDDFTTVRTSRLLVNQLDKGSSAQRLAAAIERTRDEVARELPALGLVLDQVQAMAAPLQVGGERLSSRTGQRALLALARLYQRMGRYSESISVLREGWITLGAPTNADQPGTGEFDNDWRGMQEHRWRLTTKESRSVSELRNDIQHAGFNQQPHDRAWFERQLTDLLQRWEAAIDAADGASDASQTESPTPLETLAPNGSDASAPVFYSIGVDQPITADEPLPPLPSIPPGALVVVDGRAPIWRYGQAFHRLHGSPAGAIAFFDPRLGAVVVASHHPHWREGQVIALGSPQE